MILGIITLTIAIIISVVSAYYSILGLTAIFAAAVVPVMIMGGALEAGKVVTAVWLHANWKRAEMQYKLYLVPAICFLMVLTSMGVFGFLSKAHSDQSLVSGDVQAKLAIYDEKIKTARENIEADRKQLKQMDEAVDQIMARSTSEEGATKANNIRKSQQRDRSSLAKDIEANQKLIATLNDEAAPTRAEVRKVDAEVGPIKYIAKLIYGDNPDANLLERAVVWVIILIVIVFDPLAIVLILAGIKQIEWSRKPPEPEYITADEIIGEDIAPDPVETEEPIVVEPEPVVEYKHLGDADEELEAVNLELAEAVEQPDYDAIAEQAQDASVEPESDELTQARADAEVLSNAYVQLNDDYQKISEQNAQIMQRNYEMLQQTESLQAQLDRVQQERDQLFQAHSYELARADELANRLVEEPVIEEPVVQETAPLEKYVAPVPPETAPKPKAVVEEPAPIPNPTVMDERPGDYLAEPVHQPRTDFGTEFPGMPEKGDLVLRVDFKPSRLFKWNGIKWIEIDKTRADIFTYDDQYIEFLADKINSGEYGLEDLNDAELERVNQYLSTGTHRG